MVGDAFAIGDVLSTTVPLPHTRVELYRAAAPIPGVQLTGAATDAAVRSGFGIAIEDDLGERHEWIFEPSSYRLLGERDYLTRDTVGGKAGMRVGVTAILARGITDSEGVVPTNTVD